MKALFETWISNTPGLEVIPSALYDLKFYLSGQTTKLIFFTDASKYPFHTNMHIGGMLLNPQGFLIESIAIYGVTTNIALGVCHLQIANKHYGLSPAWTFGLKRRGFPLRPGIMIPPLTNFMFSIDWDCLLYTSPSPRD